MTRKPELLTPLEAAERLGVKRNRIYAWCRTGAIACHRVGGRYFIPEWAVEKARRGEDPRPLEDPLDKPYLTLQEAAAVLGVSDRAVYEWCQKNEIAYRRPGRRYQIPREAVLERMEVIPARFPSHRPPIDPFVQEMVDAGLIPHPYEVPEGGEEDFDWDAWRKRKQHRSNHEE